MKMITFETDNNIIELFEDKKMLYKTAKTPDQMVNRLSDGDGVMINSLKELGTTKDEIVKYLEIFRDKGCRVVVLDIPSTKKIEHSDIKLQMMIETIKAMKMKGIGNVGRHSRMSGEDFVKLYDQAKKDGITPSAFMKMYDMPTGTYYRYKSTYINTRNNESEEK